MFIQLYKSCKANIALMMEAASTRRYNPEVSHLHPRDVSTLRALCTGLHLILIKNGFFVG
jgi:hypothetical protein